jgi:hypothetical protein
MIELSNENGGARSMNRLVAVLGGVILLINMPVFSTYAQTPAPAPAPAPSPIPTPVVLDTWYESVPWTSHDPFGFDGERSYLFPLSGLTLGGYPASGKLYAILPQSMVDRVQNSRNKILVVDSHTLTAHEAANYQKKLNTQYSNETIPWIMSAIGSFPNPITASVGVAMTLLDGLERLTSPEVPASAVEYLMAKGGRFDLVYIIYSDAITPTHKYVNTNIMYYVKVGDEERSYLVSSATFAVKIEPEPTFPSPPTNNMSVVR